MPWVKVTKKTVDRLAARALIVGNEFTPTARPVPGDDSCVRISLTQDVLNHLASYYFDDHDGLTWDIAINEALNAVDA